jgi:SHOCT-like protein
MSDDRRSILQMLAEGKINADEAERLLSALERGQPGPARAEAAPAGHSGAPKYLRLCVDSDEPGEDGPTRINIRVPMALLRAGVRLASIVPPKVREQVNAELAKSGVPLDINQIRPENLEELVDQLNDLSVDVNQEKTKVRIYCE